MERIQLRYVLLGAVIAAAFFFEIAAHAATIDYDHNTNFGQYKTYTWAKVQTNNSLWDARVKEAVDNELAAKGWTQVPSGGEVLLTARRATHDRHDLETFYDGFGGRRWGGFGSAITTEDNYKVGTLMIDMFDANTKNMIWRGGSSGTLSGNPAKNTKELDKDVHKMFEHFPPEVKG
jgi:hypothetical protein